MKESEEKKNKKMGLMISLGIHAAMLILFFFIMAWRQPNPPNPEYGIELNFGLDQTGGGAVQPRQRPAAQPAETEQEQAEQAEEAEPAEETEQAEQEEAPAEESPTEQAVDESVAQPVPAPEQRSTNKPAEKSVERPAERSEATERSAQPTEQSREAQTRANEKPAEDAGAASQGDNPESPGDMGSREGSVDARALYGSQGGGNGPALNLAGWTWDYIPKPSEGSNETGRIVFQIKVDDRGEIMQIITLEKTVSPAVERVYRQAVERLTFSRTSGGPTPPVSTGSITFTIRAR